MIDDDGSIVARDWAVGFVLGIGLRPEEWGKRILLTKHRQLLTPILVYSDTSIRSSAAHVSRGKAPTPSHRARALARTDHIKMSDRA